MAVNNSNNYDQWVKCHTPDAQTLKKMEKSALNLEYKPSFSIVLPVCHAEERWLREAIDSILVQVYPYWELYLVDTASYKSDVGLFLEEYRKLDSRVKIIFREKNGAISAAALNTALAFSAGEFMCVMDDDGVAAPEALFEFAQLLNRYPRTDMIYSDEDKLDECGKRFKPFFKPDWSPEYLESYWYTGQFACYRMTIVRELEEAPASYEGVHDYEFVLRFVDKARQIRHIPKVLYHGRAISPSTSSSVSEESGSTESDMKALQERLTRLKVEGTVRRTLFSNCFDVRWEIANEPLVSIIIPSAGRSAVILGREVDLLSNCINAISTRSAYRNYEVVVVDNNDLKESTLNAINCDRVRFVHFQGSFNIAAKMNLGARHAKGEHLLYLNDDAEVIAPDWLDVMLQLSHRPQIGCVGAKLYFEDGTIQHAGVSFIDNGMPEHICLRNPGNSPGYFFSLTGNRNYLAVTGACLMTRRKVFEEVGGFNEKFAVNYNDIDYCLRVHEAGYRIVFTPHAQLYHYESKCRTRYVAKHEIRLFRKLWQWKTLEDPYYSIHLSSGPPNFEIRRSPAIVKKARRWLIDIRNGRKAEFARD
jgi:O-antigen biosynthesis protein